MTDFSMLEGRLQELVSRAEALVEQAIERLPKGDERQEFLDRAVFAALMSGRHSSVSPYTAAVELWEKRQKHREQPSERELVVRFLANWGKQIQWGHGLWTARDDAGRVFAELADAIKAGKHLEPDPGAVRRNEHGDKL